ncbi:bi-domain-containing oxidoreductase [Tianweitania populi]|uniref:bi-domain-containing oxidoreductase n=1 Tax=Tianweitania populi TaxID=1607949 RepID=UPI00167AC85D|nr:bi-domain-containing oxidoreductase [Tianweitania populi]
MRVVLQHLGDGRTEVADAAAPACGPHQLLVRTSRTLVSAGTERMLLQFGKASLLGKARSQPEKVRQVLQKARTDGILPTLSAVRAKLDQPLALGYCNVGTIIEAGSGTSHFRVGDRVASNGGHAGIVAVSANLSAKVPDSVSDEAAAFTVLGAIALQGIRLAEPTLGETVAVIGLGLIGLLTVQLLRAHGCRVLGLDPDPARLALASSFGAEVVDLSAGSDPLREAARFSRDRGVDAVIIAASTESSAPVSQAAAMCSKRGRIVLVGVTGLQLSRADFYEKELSFQVSCSYGPGRYDPAYEAKGQDYPAGFVRWTAQRNFEAVLDMMADGRLDVAPLISHRFAISEAEQAYALLDSDTPTLGVLLDFGGEDTAPPAAPAILSPAHVPANGTPRIGFVGAGAYATSTLLPALKRAGARLDMVASNSGISGLHAQRKFGIARATTDASALIGDPDIDTVVIATRHSSHAALTCAALRAGKHVFVEKPLALSHAELSEIQESWRESRAFERPPLLTVGFNRRFAPHVIALNKALACRSEPPAFIMTVNAGALPPDHWTRSGEEGGRIVGEACHFVDLLRHLANSPISQATATGRGDTANLQLAFANGAIGTIHYLANGARSFPKERLEVFCGGSIVVLDNFRRLSAHNWRGIKPTRLWQQDKGQTSCVSAFLTAVQNGDPAPIPFEELAEVSAVTIDLAAQLR